MLAYKLSRLAALAALVLCASLAASQQAGQHQGSIDTFTANLTRAGFAWEEGSMIQLDPAQLCCEGKLPYGLYFNKKTPYVAVDLARIKAAFPMFQLRPDEAAVVIGVTPPEARFFNYQLYLIERFYPPASEGSSGVRKFLFASASDAVNLRTIKTLGPDPFNHAVVFIFTPDQGTESRVRAALRGAGYPEAIINTVVVPAPLLHLGLDALTSDGLAIVHRMAMFADEGAGSAYYDAFMNKEPKERPLRAFRVTPTSGSPRPFPTAPLRVRGTSRTEMDLAPSLDQLRQGILNTYAAYTATEYETRPIAYDGFDYIQRGANALADTRDALYLAAGYMPDFDLDKPPHMLTLREDEFLIAYGPKHVATGKAVYSNINVYASKAQLPLGSVFFDKFEGSAGVYGGSDSMYAYTIKRHCNGEPYCMDLAPPPYQPCKPLCETWPDCPEFVLDDQTLLAVLWRNYLDPRTNVGAPFTEVLYDRLIKFSPKPQYR